MNLTEKEAAHRVQGVELQGNKEDTRIDNLADSQSITEEQAKDSGETVFNLEAVNGKGAVFIVSNRASALAVMQGGAQAVGLGSIVNTQQLTGAAKKARRQQPLLIALDNDLPGKGALSELTLLFYDSNIPYRLYDLCGDYKTAAEASQEDRPAFDRRIKEGLALIERLEEEAQEARREEYRGKSAGAQIEAFREYVETMTPVIPTGFEQLDEAIGGGLRAALYLIGASPGAGKTTFINQIADNLAKHQQKDVLFFSLEMSQQELVARSISRYTYSHAKYPALRKTALNILDHARSMETYNAYQDRLRDTEELLTAAYDDYAEWGKRIWIVQGDGDIATDAREEDRVKDLKAHRGIRDIINDHISITGNSPVVIIDYLQIIQSHNRYWTAKENMDYITSELKRISRDCRTPVIVITSYNRAGYDTGGMAAVKESGGAEYATDILMGLNHIERKFNPRYDKKKNKVFYEGSKKDYNIHTEPRKIELEIYKNRHGKLGGVIKLNYYSAFNYFEELEPGTDYPDEQAISDLIKANEKKDH